MNPNIYRAYEIDCDVKRVKRGKASIRWHCIVRIRAPNARAHSELEILVNAWSEAGARSNGIKRAMMYIDEWLGPESYDRGAQPASHISVTRPNAGREGAAQIAGKGKQ
jgi:hypothetical protein